MHREADAGDSPALPLPARSAMDSVAFQARSDLGFDLLAQIKQRIYWLVGCSIELSVRFVNVSRLLCDGEVAGLRVS